MAEDLARVEDDVAVVRELIAFLKERADELRKKGLPVDEMVRNLEHQVDEVLDAANRLRDITAEDELLTAKREAIRRLIDAKAGLPPDLVDGMGTIAYVHHAAERAARRKRRGNKGVGG